VKTILRLVCAAAATACLPGCHIDIIRSRAGNPLKTEELKTLEPGKSTRAEAVEKLGAPERIAWKNGKDYLWYLYRDEVDAGIRFQFPPFRSAFGYQHTFLRLNEAAEDTNAIELVFDEKGVLERKSLRLSEAYQPPPDDTSMWKLHLSAHGDHSVALLGDGGVRDYNEIFHNGYRVGLGLGWQPVPVVTLLGRVSYQEHQGKDRQIGGDMVSFGDLRLYGVEVGVRLAAPIQMLWGFTDFDYVRRVLFEDDLSRSRGFRIYVEGTTGVMANSNVPVKINGVRRGHFYDNYYQFSGTVEAGAEYGWAWGAAHAGISYQTMDPFNKGNSPIDADAGAFQAVLVGGGLSLKF